MPVKKLSGKIIAIALVLLAYTPLSDARDSLPTIVLIVDDMGNNLALGEQALQLPGRINYAFLPQRNTSKVLAEAAHQLAKEVLLHAPMSNVHHKPLGKGALTTTMGQQQFIEVLQANINSIPHVRGVNNHMGSLLTQMPLQMSWLMGILKDRQLYFIDSRTSAATTAEAMANFYQLPNLRRHIFLDNDRTVEAIDKQFEKLLQLARHQPITVAIGHPYPETLQLLRYKLPSLQLRGYRLALVSEVLMASDNCSTDQSTLTVLKSSCPEPLTTPAFAYHPAAVFDG